MASILVFDKNALSYDDEVTEKIKHETEILRKLLRTPTVPEDVNFQEILRDMWDSTHDLIGTPPLDENDDINDNEDENDENNLNNKKIILKSKLLSFLTEAGLAIFFDSMTAFGIESIEDILDQELVSDANLLEFTNMTQQDIHILRKFISNKYDNSQNKQLKKNQRQNYSIISNHWLKIGFQSDNPCVEFRSVGILGACCVDHVIKFHPSTAAMVMRSQLPLAASCVNLTLLITNELFGLFREDLLNDNDNISAEKTVENVSSESNWWTSLQSSLAPTLSSPTSSSSPSSSRNMLEIRQLLLLPEFLVQTEVSSDSDTDTDDDSEVSSGPSDPRLRAMYAALNETHINSNSNHGKHIEKDRYCIENIEKRQEDDMRKHLMRLRIKSQGFLGIHSVALHIFARIALDTSATIMEFAQVLSETKKELFAVLGVSMHHSFQDQQFIVNNEHDRSYLQQFSYYLWNTPPKTIHELWERARMIPNRRMGKVFSISTHHNSSGQSSSSSSSSSLRMSSQSGRIWAELCCGSVRWFREDEGARPDMIERQLIGNFHFCPTAKISVDRVNLTCSIFNHMDASNIHGRGKERRGGGGGGGGGEGGGLLLKLNSSSDVDMWAIGLTEHVAMLNLIHQSNYYKITGRLAINSAALEN